MSYLDFLVFFLPSVLGPSAPPPSSLSRAGRPVVLACIHAVPEPILFFLLLPPYTPANLPQQGEDFVGNLTLKVTCGVSAKDRFRPAPNDYTPACLRCGIELTLLHLVICQHKHWPVYHLTQPKKTEHQQLSGKTFLTSDLSQLFSVICEEL